MACGCGIFGYFAIEKCKKKGFSIKETVFSDIDDTALRICYTNAILNENSLKSINTINFVKSDIFSNLSGKFDIILCNFPQTPFPTQFKGIFEIYQYLSKYS